MGIIEKTGSKNAHAFQRLINSTVASGVFAGLSTTKSATVRVWFASGFIGLYLCYSHSTSEVAGAYIWPTEAVLCGRFDRVSR